MLAFAGLTPIGWFWVVYVIAVLLLMWPMIILDNMPKGIQDLVRYGKLKPRLENRPYFLRLLDVPKRRFIHFYVIACMWNTFLAAMVFRAYFMGKPHHPRLFAILSLCGGEERPESIEATSVTIAICLILIQVYRRLYECAFVSVYSESTMSILVYLIGCFFYIAIGPTILSEAEGFSKLRPPPSVDFTVHWWHVFAVLLFFYASLHHHRSHVILANLRLDAKGEVITLIHRMPTGDWFELVSCPHFFAEILIYIAIGFALGLGFTTWCLALLFVIVNQVAMGLMTHQWYQTKFKNYPKSRKAIFPYIL